MSHYTRMLLAICLSAVFLSCNADPTKTVATISVATASRFLDSAASLTLVVSGSGCSYNSTDLLDRTSEFVDRNPRLTVLYCGACFQGHRTYHHARVADTLTYTSAVTYNLRTGNALFLNVEQGESSFVVDITPDNIDSVVTMLTKSD